MNARWCKNTTRLREREKVNCGEMVRASSGAISKHGSAAIDTVTIVIRKRELRHKVHNAHRCISRIIILDMLYRFRNNNGT